MLAENLIETPSHLSLANLLKAAGDSLRLDILRTLAQDSFGVLELSQIFSMKQSGMSHHLKVLTTAGLLTTRREGNSIFYRRAYFAPDHELAVLQQALFNSIDAKPLAAALKEQIEQIQQERSRAAQLFFWTMRINFAHNKILSPAIRFMPITLRNY